MISKVSQTFRDRSIARLQAVCFHSAPFVHWSRAEIAPDNNIKRVSMFLEIIVKRSASGFNRIFYEGVFLFIIVEIKCLKISVNRNNIIN